MRPPFRPRWSTPRNDDRETPGVNQADDRCPPGSSCGFGGHLLSRFWSSMRPEAAAGDDDYLGTVGETVQAGRGLRIKRLARPR
jgi:hypothetical protein